MRLSLRNRGLADNTVRRRSGVAKQFFSAAQRQRLIFENPFADLVAAVTTNSDRFYFEKLEEADKVLDACGGRRVAAAVGTGPVWGGLRVPSEALRLRWSDIDWEHGRLTVTSPKTEHHDGHGSRVVPNFTELQLYLQFRLSVAPEVRRLQRPTAACGRGGCGMGCR